MLIPQAEIASAVERLASAIARDYREQNPLLLGILKGSFVFMADLIRKLDFPLEVDFIRLSSYGSGQQTKGRVKVVQGLRLSVRGRHDACIVPRAVVVVESMMAVTLCDFALRAGLIPRVIK